MLTVKYLSGVLLTRTRVVRTGSWEEIPSQIGSECDFIVHQGFVLVLADLPGLWRRDGAAGSLIGALQRRLPSHTVT